MHLLCIFKSIFIFQFKFNIKKAEEENAETTINEMFKRTNDEFNRQYQGNFKIAIVSREITSN